MLIKFGHLYTRNYVATDIN